VNAGELLTYNLTASNLGPNPATDVVVRDALPAGVTYQADTGGCLVSAGVVTCNLGTDTLVNPSVPDGTQIVNTATAAAATADPDTGNNTATTTATVNAQADLSVTKDANIDLSNPAPRIVFTIVVTNLGPSDAQDVVATDPLPLNPKKVRYLFDTGNGACTYSLDTHAVTCNLGTLAAGASQSVSIYVDARGSLGVITNTVSVTSRTDDPNLANNSARKDIRVKGGPGK
jgi:uncharacterized repeat protein (TIGR01451 family)